MGSIRRPSDSSREGTKSVEFIWCVDGREPQIHEIWCLGYNGVTHEFHTTAQIYDVAETVGQFLTQNLSENGRRISFIDQISINGSVEILGIPAEAWECGFTFIDNIQAPTVTSGWGGVDTSNQNWRFTLGGPYGNDTVAWGSNVPDRPDFMNWSP